MKRIIYISKLPSPLTNVEIEAIGSVSSKKNSTVGVTGLLLYFKELFFQIIEGESKEIDMLFEKIKNDSRHTDVLCLKSESDISERLFPYWSMKTINLDKSDDEIIRPVKILLQTIIESHTIIERYTQPAVMKILNKGINPLTVPTIRIERIILFGDIVSYSTISEKIDMQDLTIILNKFFEVCSRTILKRGGEVNKFIGDGIMAYFDSSCADHAIHACLDILEELDSLRMNASTDSPLQLLYSGFGLAQGIVLEGNMGSEIKTDYTIIGNAVNTASRLESLTREVKRSLLISKEVKDNTKEPWVFKNLGKFNLKGKQDYSEVYAIEHEAAKIFQQKILFNEKIERVLQKKL